MNTLPAEIRDHLRRHWWFMGTSSSRLLEHAAYEIERQAQEIERLKLLPSNGTSR